MKRVLIASFLLGICIITLTAGGITQLADGRIRVGESEFAIIHWNGGWSPTVQDDKSVHFPGEAARDIGDGVSCGTQGQK